VKEGVAVCSFRFRETRLASPWTFFFRLFLSRSLVFSFRSLSPPFIFAATISLLPYLPLALTLSLSLSLAFSLPAFTRALSPSDFVSFWILLLAFQRSLYDLRTLFIYSLLPASLPLPALLLPTL